MRGAVEIGLVVLALINFLKIASLMRRIDSETKRTLYLYAGLALGAFINGSVGGNALGLLALIGFTLLPLMVAVARAMVRPAAPSPNATRPSLMPISLAIALWGWLFLVDFALAPLTVRTLSAYCVAFSVPALMLVFRSFGGLPHPSVALVGTAYLIGAVLVGALVGNEWRDCDVFKCNAIGGLYRGPFPSENYLAIIAVFTLVSWLAVKTPMSGRIAGVLFSIAVVLATGSRSALVAIFVALVWCVMAGAFMKRDSCRKWHLPVPLASLTVALVSLLSVNLISDARNDTFSNRGSIWIRAYEAVLQGNPLVGLGLSDWGRLQAVGFIPEHFAHSGYLIILFSGGVVGLVLFGLTLAALLARTQGGTRWGSAWGSGPVIVFLVYSLSEVIWNPLALDSFSFVVIGLFAETALCIGPAERAGLPPEGARRGWTVERTAPLNALRLPLERVVHHRLSDEGS